MRKYTRLFIYFSAFILAFTACTPQHKLIYLQGDKDFFEQKETQKFQHRIRSGDMLSINVYSINENALKLFSRAEGARTLSSTDLGAYLNSFLVSESGHIKLPMIENVLVADLTLKEAEELLQKELRNYFFDAVVDVKLISFKFSVLGEVNKPGSYRVYDPRLNIFEAIGLAGDLTVYGKRNIILIRNTKTGQILTEVNLKDRNVINSDFFYLQPNDLIYVPPHKAKTFGFTKVPISEILSIVTTMLVVISFLKQ